MDLYKNYTSNRLPIYLGGITIFTGFGFLVYKNYFLHENLLLEIPDEKVIRILKLFKKEFYPLFNKLKNLSLKYQSEYKKKYSNLPESFLKKLEITLTENNPNFKREVEKIEEKIYRKNNMKQNKKQFEKYCLKLSLKNLIIKSLLKEIKYSFNRSLRGIEEDIKIEIPNKLTSNIILDIYKNKIIGNLKKLLNLCLKNKRKNEEFNRKLTFFTDEDISNNIFEKYKIKVNEFIHPQLLFTFSKKKFAQENLIFKQDLTKIELMENNLYKKVRSQNPYFGLYEEIEKIKFIGKRKNIFENLVLDKIKEEKI